MSQVLEVTGAYNKLRVRIGARGFAGRVKNVVVSAMVGGTMAKVVGGKFANGAITGAFSRMFNDLNAAHQAREKLASKIRALEAEALEAGIRYDQKYGGVYEYGIDYQGPNGSVSRVRSDENGNLYTVEVGGAVANSTPFLAVGLGFAAFGEKLIYELGALMIMNPRGTAAVMGTAEFALNRYTPEQGLLYSPAGGLGTVSSRYLPPENYEYRLYNGLTN